MSGIFWDSFSFPLLYLGVIYGASELVGLVYICLFFFLRGMGILMLLPQMVCLAGFYVHSTIDPYHCVLMTFARIIM